MSRSRIMRHLTFRLSTLFIVVTLAAIGSWHGAKAYRRWKFEQQIRQFIREINASGGGQEAIKGQSEP